MRTVSIRVIWSTAKTSGVSGIGVRRRRRRRRGGRCGAGPGPPPGPPPGPRRAAWESMTTRRLPAPGPPSERMPPRVGRPPALAGTDCVSSRLGRLGGSGTEMMRGPAPFFGGSTCGTIFGPVSSLPLAPGLPLAAGVAGVASAAGCSAGASAAGCSGCGATTRTGSRRSDFLPARGTLPFSGAPERAGGAGLAGRAAARPGRRAPSAALALGCLGAAGCSAGAAAGASGAWRRRAARGAAFGACVSAAGCWASAGAVGCGVSTGAVGCSAAGAAGWSVGAVRAWPGPERPIWRRGSTGRSSRTGRRGTGRAVLRRAAAGTLAATLRATRRGLARAHGSATAGGSTLPRTGAPRPAGAPLWPGRTGWPRPAGGRTGAPRPSGGRTGAPRPSGERAGWRRPSGGVPPLSAFSEVFGAGAPFPAVEGPPIARSASASSTEEAAAFTSRPAAWSLSRRSLLGIPCSLAISWIRFFAMQSDRFYEVFGNVSTSP